MATTCSFDPSPAAATGGDSRSHHRRPRMSRWCAKCGERPIHGRDLCRACSVSARRRMGWLEAHVDAAPVRAHLQALQDAGVSLRRLRALSGVSDTAMRAILAGPHRLGPPWAPQVSQILAEKLLSVPVPTRAWDGLADTQMVCAVGTRRRLQALVAIGWPIPLLSQQLGISDQEDAAMWGDDYVRTTVLAARTVDRLYRQLEMQPGPSTSARSEACQRGWAPPLAWDEDAIDDPAAAAASGAPDRLGFAQRYREYQDLGVPEDDIARRMGISIKSLKRQRARAGMLVDSASTAAPRAKRRAS